LHAGLVGIGLCHLFAASSCEGKQFESKMDNLANHMGLFLQKTNIIRDYLEDILEEPAPRMFWPQEIWGKHANKLADFKEPQNRCAIVAVCNLNLRVSATFPVYRNQLCSYLNKLRELSRNKFQPNNVLFRAASALGVTGLRLGIQC
jgi:phytoene/squalene synthetase